MEPLRCLNCGTGFAGKFCPQCGQSAEEKRISAHWLLHDVPHSVFHIDRGFFFTIKKLFTQPAVMVKDYLEGRRVKYFRPFAYVVLMTTICSLIIKGLRQLTDTVYQSRAAAAPEAAEGGFFAHYFSVFIFIMIPFAALITWLSFFKRKYNYWEHFLINTYLAAQLNLFLVIVNIVALCVALFTNKTASTGSEIIVTVFMMGFLLLYGYTFGGLMHIDRRYALRLTLVITLMNAMLFFLYYLGLKASGVIQ
ncbi:hypothetical protein GCM10027051_21420 [Niabella terrae]